jgi:hypothetical protein
MKNRFVISENDRRSILSMYGLLTEEITTYTFSGLIKLSDNSVVQGVKVFVIDDKGAVIQGSNNKPTATTSDVDGNYTLTCDLDNTKKYSLKFTMNGETDLLININDMSKLAQKIDGKFSDNSKDLREVKLVELKGSSGSFYATELNFSIKTEQDRPIKGAKIKLKYEDKYIDFINDRQTDKNGKIDNLIFTNKDNPFLETIDKEKGVKNPIKKIPFILKITKGKLKTEQNIEVNVFNKLLTWKTFNCKNKEGKKLELVLITNAGNLYDRNDLTLIKTLPVSIRDQPLAKISEELSKDGYSEFKSIDVMDGLLPIYKKFQTLIKEYFFREPKVENNIPITLDIILPYTIKVQNSSGDFLPNVPITILSEKNGESIDNQVTNEKGEAESEVELLESETIGDKTFRKRKIWVRVRKKGYDTYNNSFVVSGENNEVLITLQRTEFNPDEEENTDDFTKENTYFTFYGKSGKDVKQRYGSQFEAEEAARKDALNQFLESVEKFTPYKKLLKDKIPNGGELVYRRGNETDGYYVILKFSRKYLRKFVKQYIPKKESELKTKPVNTLNIDPAVLMTFNEALNRAVNQGKFLTVFYYIDRTDMTTLKFRNPGVVKKLNTDSINLFIDEKSENSGTASRVLNLRSTPTIAIMENSDVIKLKQSIYSNEDLDYVANWIMSNLD